MSSSPRYSLFCTSIRCTGILPTFSSRWGALVSRAVGFRLVTADAALGCGGPRKTDGSRSDLGPRKIDGSRDLVAFKLPYPLDMRKSQYLLVAPNGDIFGSDQAPQSATLAFRVIWQSETTPYSPLPLLPVLPGSPLASPSPTPEKPSPIRTRALPGK